MRVLVTGGAGRIGTHLFKNLKGKYEFRGLDIVASPLYKDFVVANVTDWNAVFEATKGVDAIIHLSNVGPEWEQAKQSMIGTYNVYESAARNGVKHIAFASRGGIFPRTFYPRHMMRTATMLPRPESYYSITKVFGEAMGDMYSAKYGISIVSVRIGNFDPQRTQLIDPHQMGNGDCVRVFEAAINHSGGKHERVFGVSDSNWPLYDIEHGKKAIGYYPQEKSIVPEDQIERPPKK